MKILVSIYEHPTFGGAEISTRHLVEGLIKLGHEVIIASACDWSAYAKTYKFFKFRLKLPIFLLQQWYLSWCLGKVIKKEKPDLIHAQDRLTTPGAIVVGIKKKVPIIVNFRDYWFACPNSACITKDGELYDTYGKKQLSKEKWHRKLWNFYKIQELKRIRKLLNKADLKVANSNCIRNKLNVNGITDSIVIPITRDLSLFSNCMKKFKKRRYDEYYILYVGNLAVNKGIKQLMSFMPFLLHKHPEMNLLIAGDGVLRKEVETHRTQHPTQIHLLGNITQENLAIAYRSSNVLLFPSIWEEPFGGVVLEAMSSGTTPIIASNRGWPLDIIKNGKTGFIVDPFDNNQWIEKIEFLFNNKAEGRKMAEVAKRFISNYYNLNNIIKAWEKRYCQLIKKRKR